MTRPPRQIKLGAFLMQTGHHIAAWRHPGAQADAAVNFRHYVDLARRAEAAKFDAIFLADAVGVRNTDLPSLSRARAATTSSRLRCCPRWPPSPRRSA